MSADRMYARRVNATPMTGVAVRGMVVAYATLAALTAACGDTAVTSVGAAKPVVRAYLYAGQPVNDIQLRWSVPIGTSDSASAAPPINDATVTLMRGGQRFALVKSAGDSGYYQYNGSDLVIREGDAFSLEAKVSGQTITAQTIVPTKPSGARMAATTLKIPNFTFGPGSPRPDFSSTQTIVRWTRTAGALYFVTLDNVEPTPVALDFGLPGGVRGRRRLIFPPTTADSLPVNALGLPYYGRYVVNVWRVNEEYAQLYATLQQDSRDLNEPFTNVRGGLGVFTAFSADTTSVTVVKAP